MARHRRNAHIKPPAREPAPVPVVGPGRYTATRFLSDCSDETYWFLVNSWKEGDQLDSHGVPVDGLPAVVILAAYARQYGVDLVDDYVALLDRYWETLKETNHPDKFFASCIVILDETGQAPDEASFETIRVPDIYEELLG